MDSYLSKVKKTDEKEKSTESVEEKMPKKENAEEFKEEEKDYMEGKKSVFQKLMDFIAGSEEENPGTPAVKTEEADDEKELEKYDKKGKGFVSSVKGLFSKETKVEEKAVQQEEHPAMNEDIKEVLRIQNKWLTMLPARTIREFKSSDDYRVYKETLQKYGLIKVK